MRPFSLRVIGLIFRREMLDLLRDRRTLFGMILVPVLIYPALMVALSRLVVRQVGRIESQAFTVAVIGWRELPELLERGEGEAETRWDFLRAEAGEREAMRRALAEGRIHVLVEVLPAPPGAGPDAAAVLRATYNGADEGSLAGWRRFDGRLAALRRAAVERRLRELSVDASVLEPFRVEARDASTPVRRGAFHLGRVVCVMLVMMAALGAFYPAVDAASGEKERGTMQTLLVSPARRSEIVLGKYAAVLAICLVTSLLNLASMAVTFSRFFGGMLAQAELSFSPEPASLLLMLVLMVPLAGLFAAVSLGISAYASSYKEAMLYLSPFLLAASLGAFAPLIPGLPPAGALELAPVVNASLVLYRVVQGTATAGQVALNLAVNAAYAALALRWVWWIFEREDVLLRGAMEVRWRFWERRGPARPHPSMPEAVVYCGLGLALAVGLSGWLGAAPVLVALGATQIVVLLLPMLAMLALGGIDARRALRLGFPGWRNLGVAALSAAALVVVSGTLIDVLLRAFEAWGLQEPGRARAEAGVYLKLLGPEQTRAGLAAAALLIAAVAPLCEEMVFRGFLLSAFRPALGGVLAVAVTGALFGLLHGDMPARHVGLALVGACFGTMVVRSGSLWTGVAAHAVYNGLVLAVALPALSRGEIGESVGAVSLLPAAIALAVVLLGLKLMEPAEGTDSIKTPM
jgi:sodium transport system permease protein